MKQCVICSKEIAPKSKQEFIFCGRACQMGPHPEKETLLVVIRKQELEIEQMQNEFDIMLRSRNDYKDAWFRQRDITGQYALREYDLIKSK